MPDRAELPDDATLAWAKSVLGPFRLRSRYAHDHGYSQLWRLACGRDHVWLKMHAHHRKWAGEVHALTRWTPELGRTPTVIAFRDEPRAMLLSEMPGGPAESLTLDEPAEERMWYAAGLWLARLHARQNDWLGEVEIGGSPSAPPSTDPESFVRATFDRRLVEGSERNLFTAAERDFVLGVMSEGLPSLAGERAVAVHRDFTPRNWLTEPDGTLTAIIDFEHARWDVRATDLNRPWDYEFLRNPRLESAFYEAYGLPDPRLRAQIELLRLMQAVAGYVWGVLVGETTYAYRNRDALRRLMGT